MVMFTRKQPVVLKLDLYSSLFLGGQKKILLKQTEFIWDADHDAAFSAVKQELTSPSILAFFQPGGELRLQTDA